MLGTNKPSIRKDDFRLPYFAQENRIEKVADSCCSNQENSKRIDEMPVLHRSTISNSMITPLTKCLFKCFGVFFGKAAKRTLQVIHTPTHFEVEAMRHGRDTYSFWPLHKNKNGLVSDLILAACSVQAEGDALYKRDGGKKERIVRELCATTYPVPEDGSTQGQPNEGTKCSAEPR